MAKFDFKQPVNFPLSLILVMLLGYILAWYTVSTGNKIVKNARNSETFSFKAEKKAGLLKN